MLVTFIFWVVIPLVVTDFLSFEGTEFLLEARVQSF